MTRLADVTLRELLSARCRVAGIRYHRVLYSTNCILYYYQIIAILSYPLSLTTTVKIMQIALRSWHALIENF